MKNKKSMLILFLMVFSVFSLVGVGSEVNSFGEINQKNGEIEYIQEFVLNDAGEIETKKINLESFEIKKLEAIPQDFYIIKPEYNNYNNLNSYAYSSYGLKLDIHNWTKKFNYTTFDYCDPNRKIDYCNYDYIEEFEFNLPKNVSKFGVQPNYYLVNRKIDSGPDAGKYTNSYYFLVNISIFDFVTNKWENLYNDTSVEKGWKGEAILTPLESEFIKDGKVRLRVEAKNRDNTRVSAMWESGYINGVYYKASFLFYFIFYLYIEKSSYCYDGVQNGDETGVDCGGSCAPCVSCDNRIKDGDEEGVDCGGSCQNDCIPLKILAVPLRWTGTQSEFNDAVDTQINFFINATPLKNCPETIKVEKLNVRNYNFDNFSCSKTNCGVYKIKPFIESKGINVKNYHYIIGFVENSPCFLAGCSNGEDTAWVETEYDVVAAHEIGHFYGLEDEYCSNQAGSKDSRCNDGNESWTLIGITILPNDINYLDADLGCDPHGQPCCNYDPWHNCSTLPRAGYGVCCKGNIVNSEGGRAIMSYANADGPREFDEHSKNHLAKYPKLNCPSGLADYNIETVITGKIIDLNLNVFQNNSVEEQNIHLVDGEGNIHDSKEGNYNLLIYDNENFVLFNHSVYHLFDYDGPVIDGNDYSQINLTSFQLSMKIPYDNNMYILYLKHNDITIFSKILDFCNQDGICNGTETYLSCWDDCKSYSQDGLCLNYTGDGCDPDCAEDIDPDCKSTLVGKTFLGVNSITHANEIKMELLNKLTLNFTVIETMNNNNGDFVIDGIEPGNYSIWVKPEYYLAVRNNSVELVEGKNNIEFRASHVDFNNGPSNQSYNKVDFWDLGPFLKAWDSNCSSENYKWYIDINSNCKIDFYDLPPFSGSYGLVGEPSLKP